MIRIELENDFVITSDSMNFILNKKNISNGKKTKGEEILKPVSYHTQLDMIMNSYVDKVILEKSDATSIQGLLKEYKDLKEYVKQEISRK